MSIQLQQLIMTEDVFDKLYEGKTCTIRTGRRDIKLAHLELQSLDDKREETVLVKRVVYCKLKDVPMEFVINDGFTDHLDMEHQMKKFYPDIDLDTECTVVEFEMTR
jgi:hypothetical protein